jgi:hypothetical protein
MPGSLADIIKIKATNKMPTDELYKRIISHLKGQTMCVLCTAAADGQPRATPVEYYSNKTTLYCMADPGVKIENLKVNPRVSVGICNNPHPIWTNPDHYLNVKSVQITGRGKVINPGDPEYRDALKYYKWKIFWSAIGWPANEEPTRPFIMVESDKIEYMEFALKKDGYSSKQTWTRA